MKEKIVPKEETPLLLDLAGTIALVLDNMKTSENTRITRHDLGIKISGFYNHQFHIRLDLVRLDKMPFFYDNTT